MSNYLKDFKQQIMKEKLSGRTVKELSKVHEVGVSTIFKWMKRYNQENNQTIKLINITNLIKDNDIHFKINDYKISVDETNLEKLLKVLKS